MHHITAGTYLQALLTSKNRDTPVCAAATSMCRTTSADNQPRALGENREPFASGPSCTWPQHGPKRPPPPVLGAPARPRAPTCPGGHQLMQFPHGHAARIVEVGHVQGCGRVCGIYHEVSYHKEGPHFIQPRLLIIVQPGKRPHISETLVAGNSCCPPS